MKEMTSTKKYFLQRAIMISLMAVVIGMWLITAKHNLSGLYLILILVIAGFGQRSLKKASLNQGNPFKTGSDGYSLGLKHDDEREAQNAAVASFISARMTIIFVMLIMGLAAVFFNGTTWSFFGFSLPASKLFNAVNFGIVGTAILLVQQWSFFFSFSHLNK
jgi:hypothetical protein